MKRRGEQGVTLIEIAVVMAIVAIMALFMAPAIGEWIDNFRIRQAGRDISSTLQEARMKAISSRQQQTVTFNITNDTYVPSGGSETAVPRGINIETGSTTSVSFDPDGTSSTGTITINNEDGKEYQIGINAVGRVSIQET